MYVHWHELFRYIIFFLYLYLTLSSPSHFPSPPFLTFPPLLLLPFLLPLPTLSLSFTLSPSLSISLALSLALALSPLICLFHSSHLPLSLDLLTSTTTSHHLSTLYIPLPLSVSTHSTVETLYSTIYYSKYFIELSIDKSTQYFALWTHKRHPIPRPFGRAMECLLWVLQQKLIML